MIVAIHQPNFLPWLGFFNKLFVADLFILLDSVPYTKNSYQNRVKIKSSQGEQWLTLPVLSKGRYQQTTQNVPINPNVRWQKSHLGTLRTNYSRAPYFAVVMPWLTPLYEQNHELLAEFNCALLTAVLSYLNVSANIVSASTLHANGMGSDMLLQLIQDVRGTTYLSGLSGRNYLDLAAYEAAHIEVQFQTFEHPVYQQQYGDFISHLSIIDLLMNVHPTEAIDVIHSGFSLSRSDEPIHMSIVVNEEMRAGVSS